jgi:hypothetical protein
MLVSHTRYQHFLDIWIYVVGSTIRAVLDVFLLQILRRSLR